MSRTTDAEGHVTGVELIGAKAGSDIEGRTVLIPDPMGATGSSMSDAITHYETKLHGRPAKVVAVNLIVTPEYVRRITRDHPDAVIYALRYDRGLSAPSAFGSVPGTADGERGLDEHQYIVPGAGGLGEILNNVWV